MSLDSGSFRNKKEPTLRNTSWVARSGFRVQVSGFCLCWVAVNCAEKPLVALWKTFTAATFLSAAMLASTSAIAQFMTNATLREISIIVALVRTMAVVAMAIYWFRVVVAADMWVVVK